MKFGKKRSNDDLPQRRQSADAVEETRASLSDLSKRYSFRRNRTLTGSSSSQITSSGELNAELRSPRAHVHHLTSLRRRLGLYLAIVGVGALVLYILINQLVTTLAVQVSKVNLLPPADQTAYQQAIDDYYASRPVERLRFLLNESELTSHVQATRPEVKQLTIQPGAGLGKAIVSIEPRQPIARWSFDEGDQYVDETGTVFIRNYQAAPLLTIVDDSGIEASDVKVVASNRFLSFVGQVIAGAKAEGLNVSKVIIPAQTTRQVAISMKGQATQYRLSVDRIVGEQVEDVARIHAFLKRKGIRPQYVDVRVQGKAFYR